jgi:hypothetical protein
MRMENLLSFPKTMTGVEPLQNGESVMHRRQACDFVTISFVDVFDKDRSKEAGGYKK